jgi:hypothetical protein
LVDNSLAPTPRIGPRGYRIVMELKFVDCHPGAQERDELISVDLSFYSGAVPDLSRGSH